MFESIGHLKKYCNSLTRYSRYKTREVKIGDIPLGSDNPIRIQSMTTTNTMDTIATVEQTIRMVNAGCEYVRITAPSKLEAENLAEIKKELQKRGYNVPLIADIHFTPNAAEVAARMVEKVRVNPGNYADRKKFQIIEYDDLQYEAELERIRQKFSPLVKICKEYGTAMRIGTNHGSLSDRIMSRYGDTPLGMVESALEFVRICEELNYYDIILSMKASNPQIMIQAYRLLISKMEEEEMNYPLHLGVTEAGGGEDGRIKSAMGIGTLLEDGLGDTIRVSLTEDPEFEAPVAIQIAERYKNRENHQPIPDIEINPLDPFSYNKRVSREVSNIGGGNVTKVVADYGDRPVNNHADLEDIGYQYFPETDKWNISDSAADFIYLGKNPPPFELPNGLMPVYDFEYWQHRKLLTAIPLLTLRDYLENDLPPDAVKFVTIKSSDFSVRVFDKIKSDRNAVITVDTKNEHGMADQRRIFFELLAKKINNPVIIRRQYNSLTEDRLRLYPSTDFGALLIDGLGDGVWFKADKVINISEENQEAIPRGKYIRRFQNKTVTKEKIINRILFGILQAARVRISKTEYIACPSCGRTLFDLQETTEMIRRRTEHLKGVKIAIMGCIVNGPGEMADADYGYVGSGIGKITLYKGKDIINRNIAAEHAVDALINLIKEDNRWMEAK
jgi:(E)-4-hydroxy-3-methylbut-2-enyl-diphosphate synthase